MTSIEARWTRWRKAAYIASTVTRAGGLLACCRVLSGRTQGALLQVENTSCCNFRCDYCPTHSEKAARDVARGHMTMNTFERILDAWAQATVVVFQGQGEPLLDPSLFDKLALARRRRLITQVITNGSLLPRADTARRLLVEGPDILLVSLDAVGPVRNASLRKGLDYGRVYDSLKDLCAARNGMRRMIVGLLSIVHGPFSSETENALRDFDKIDLDMLLYKQLNGAYADRIEDYTAPALDPYVPLNVRRSLHYLLRHQSLKTARPCAQLRHDLPYFLWDGRRTPCCILNDARHTGPEFSRPMLLRRFAERDMPAECERCSFFSGYTRGGN